MTWTCKLARTGAHLAIFGGLWLVLLVAYWSLWPYRIITESDGTRKVLTPVVMQGGTLLFPVHSCKHYDLVETISRELLDGFIYQLPPVQSNQPTGCYSRIVAVPIPDATPPGMYRMRITVSFQPNPIRTIRYTWDTTAFEVQSMAQHHRQP